MATDHPLLLTGGDGFVGGHIRRLCPEAISLGRADGDLLELGEALRKHRPRAVIHLAALSRIPRCTAEPEEAWRINVEGTRVVARAARETGARIVHLSSDQVFDGTRAPYRSTDPPSPLSVYGETKAASERVAREEGGGNVLVVRLHLVVGHGVPPRMSATDELVTRAARREPSVFFEDEWRSPIHVIDAARALLELAAHPLTGIFHLGGPERLSRLQIARAILHAARLDERLARPGTLRSAAGPPRAPDTSFAPETSREILARPVRPLREALAEDFGHALGRGPVDPAR
ncbi:MAG: sugar nucleotide-binding protein [Planctomycetota bacterium]